MAIVKNTNKKTGVTYVYESKSYWDPDLKSPRSHRTLIGKIMPGSEEIIPTGKRGGTREKKSVEEKEAAWKAQKAEEEIKRGEEEALGLEDGDYRGLYEKAKENYEIRESYMKKQIAELRKIVAEQENLLLSLNNQMQELTAKTKKTLLLLEKMGGEDLLDEPSDSEGD